MEPIKKHQSAIIPGRWGSLRDHKNGNEVCGNASVQLYLPMMWENKEKG